MSNVFHHFDHHYIKSYIDWQCKTNVVKFNIKGTFKRFIFYLNVTFHWSCWSKLHLVAHFDINCREYPRGRFLWASHVRMKTVRKYSEPTAFVFYIIIQFSILWYRFRILPNIKIYHFQLVSQPFSTIFFVLFNC